MHGLVLRTALRPGASRVAAKLALLLALAGSATGCVTTRPRPDVPPPAPIDYRQRHPIAIQEAPRGVELFIGAGRGALTAPQRAKLIGFAGAWRRQGTGGIVIAVPAGTPNARAAAAAAREAGALLAGAGVPPRAIQIQSVAVADPLVLVPLRLSYPTMVARAGPCGLWPDDLGPTLDRKYTENRPYWNHGCANQRNLAAMVAEPADLVQPRAEDPIYTPRRTNVLDKYRAGVPTGAVTLNPDKGAISDVGR